MAKSSIFPEFLKMFNKQIHSTVAENTSSYSNLLVWKIRGEQLTRPREFIALWIILVFTGGPNAIDQIQHRDRMLKIVYHKQEEGQWKILREILSIPKLAPQLLCDKLLEYYHPNEIFGNTARDIRRIARKIKVQNPYVKDKRSVRYPERKRGYDDKGSLPDKNKLGLEYYFIKKSEKPEISLPEVQPQFITDWGIYRENDIVQTRLVELDASVPTKKGGKRNVSTDSRAKNLQPSGKNFSTEE